MTTDKPAKKIWASPTLQSMEMKSTASSVNPTIPETPTFGGTAS